MQPLVSAKCACSFRSPYGLYAQMTAMRGSDKGVELGGKKQVIGLSETLVNYEQMGCKPSLFLFSGQPKLTPSLG